MANLLTQAIKTLTEQTVLDYYLSITKNTIKCTDTNEKKPIFYVYDNEFNFYKKNESILIAKLFRDEMLSNLAKELNCTRIELY